MTVGPTPGAAQNPWILVISMSGTESRTIPFQIGTVFGRSSQCSCILPDPTVSGTHAHIIEQGAVAFIEDLGSENRTRIPGGPTLAKGQSHALEPGVIIRMGGTFIEVRSAAVDEETVHDFPAPAPDQTANLAATVRQSTSTPARTSAGPSASAHAPAPQAPAPPTHNIPANTPVSHLDNSADQGALQFGPGAGSDLSAKTAAKGDLQAAQARLVIASQVDRRVHAVQEVQFSIGRGKQSQCRISHPAISTPHASIRFDIHETRFMIEDENSKNSTYMNGRLVLPGAPHELAPDTHLRFGPVDALFIVEVDNDGAKLAQNRQHYAAKILADTKVITVPQKLAAIKANKASGKHIGETLLLAADPITVKQWTDALEQARYMEIRSGFAEQIKTRWIIAILVAVVIIVALIALS